MCASIWGGPKIKWNVCIKNLFKLLKLQSPSKHFPFDAIHLLRHFSTIQNSFWTRGFSCDLVLLPFFVAPLPHWQNVALWGLFSSGETKKKSLGARSGEYGGWAMEVKLFLVKNCWTLSAVWAGALVSHPSWNGQTHWGKSSKKIHWRQT